MGISLLFCSNQERCYSGCCLPGSEDSNPNSVDLEPVKSKYSLFLSDSFWGKSAATLCPMERPTCQETEGMPAKELRPSVQQPVKDQKLPITMWLNLEDLPSFAPSDETAALADIVRAALWETLRQRHPVRPYLGSYPQKLWDDIVSYH